MPWRKALKRVGQSVSDAIHAARSSVPEQLDLAEETCNQAIAEFKQYLQVHDVELLRSSINHLEQAAAMIDETPSLLLKKYHTPLTDYLHEILRIRAVHLRLLFHETDEQAYLDQSIEILQLLFRHSAKNTPEKFTEAISLALHLSDRYFLQSSSDGDDLDAALEAARSALSVSKRVREPIIDSNSDDRRAYELAQCLVQEPLDVAKGIYYYYRGVALHIRSVRLQDIPMVSTANEYYTQAVQLLPSSHPLHLSSAIEVVVCEIDLLTFSTDISRVDQMMAALSDLKLENSTLDDRVKVEMTRSRLFRAKFQNLPTIEDLDKAVEAAQEAVNEAGQDQRNQIVAIHLLVDLLGTRASMRRSQSDINLAKEFAQKAIDLIPNTDYKKLSAAYGDLGDLLGIEHTLFRKPENLSTSMPYLRQALEILPQNSPARATILHTLYLGLRDEYIYASDEAVLDEMILIERQALAMARQLNATTNIPKILVQLSDALDSRYRRKGNSEDLREAVDSAETALASIPKGSQSYADALSGLSIRLRLRSVRFSRTEDLDRAISLVSEAIKYSGNDQQGTLVNKSSLASCLASRFKVTQDMKDIDDAITLMRDVNEARGMSEPTWLCDLAQNLYARYKASRGLEEKRKLLDEAISCQTLAISLQSSVNPEQTWYLFFLGELESCRRDLLQGTDNNRASHVAILTRSAGILERAFAFKFSTPLSRIAVAMAIAKCYIELENWARLSTILHETILLFPKVSPIALDQDDRQKRLQGMTEMSTYACISYMKLRDIDTGMEVFDAGRGIMGRTAIRQYDHLPVLKSIDPALHERYIKLRQALSTPISSGKVPDQDAVAVRQKDQISFDEIEDKIRRLPGMEGFNKNLSSSDIKALAREGPLVSFCESIGEHFAIIVTEDKINVLPLPDLQHSAVVERVPHLIGKNRLSLWPPSKRVAAAKKMKALLGWLWDVAVRPVLAHLNFLERKQDPLPRIWWITGGRLGLMPLHAAGKTSKTSSENAFDYVVSSYISTCDTLAFVRQCQAKTGTGTPQVALVSMPETAGHTPLQTADEEQAVRDGFPVDAAQKPGQLSELIQPAAAEVLAKVRDGTTDIFHFCCHNEPDLADPSRTALLFGRDPKAPLPERLAIAQLREYNANNDLDSRAPRLAYLSGCCTAQQYDVRLLDESIHLALIFQLIGFPAVIGTLWEADDKAAVFIARTFYAELIRLETNAGTQDPPSNASHVARALHTAIVACRAAKFGKLKAIDDVLLWANFVHFGA